MKVPVLLLLIYIYMCKFIYFCHTKLLITSASILSLQLFSYNCFWTFHIMVASVNDMHTSTVICTLTQSTLTAAAPCAYTQTPIYTSTLSGTLEGFYHPQSQTPSVYIHSHYHFKYEKDYHSLLLVHCKCVLNNKHNRTGKIINLR